MTTMPSSRAPIIEGVFPLLCTPYAENGALDCAILAREAAFVADCGVQGVIWPCAHDALDLLSPEEVREGLAAVAAALDGRGVWFTPCCPGRDVADMLRRVADAETVAARHPNLAAALLIRLADDAKSDADYTRQYDALAAATRLPVIVQTYNGQSPMPSAQMLVDLTRRHPDSFGWFKVEGTGPVIVPCKRALVAAQPVVKTVFTGWGGRDWLYDHRRLGTRGVITQRPMYADLMAAIWRALMAESGGARLSRPDEADDLFAKFISLRNLEEVLPAPEMRGWNLSVLKRRGVFVNTLSRTGRRDGGRWEVADIALSDDDRAEVDARLSFALSTLPSSPSPFPVPHSPKGQQP